MTRIDVSRWIKAAAPPAVLDALFALKFARQGLRGRRRYVAAVRGRQGIEIGGPSPLFGKVLPLYQAAATVDGVNFSDSTVWEGTIRPGPNYRYFADKAGWQYIADAVDLSEIEAQSRDFVISSNCLEHVANPIKALHEWRRVLREEGALVLVLPNSRNNFDHRRPITSFEHLVDDYDRGMPENDMTHLEEILELHDLSMDPPAGDIEQFKRRSADNFRNRTLHHHVFDLNLMGKMLAFAGFDVRTLSATPSDLFALAVKTSAPR